MKRTVLVFGLIAGAIVTTMMLYSVSRCYSSADFEGNELLGYAGMIVAFAFIFVGVKNYRDKYLNGAITFGKAFKTGLLITVVASTLYVLVWLVDYYVFVPDFMDKYCTHMVTQTKASGVSQAELNQKLAQMNSLRQMYKNPLFVVLLTYVEILPIGLVISLLSALILKRRNVRTGMGGR